MLRLLVISVVLFSVVNAELARGFAYPLAFSAADAAASYTGLDIASVVMGVRKLGADIAWIQLLQYYGTPEKPLDEDRAFQLSWDMTKYLFGAKIDKEVCFTEGCDDKSHYHPQIDGGVYPLFLQYCYRIVALDPSYYFTYLYGGGALAWNLNRPQEALLLLEHGIAVLAKYQHASVRDIHEPYWQLNLYVSAIVYRKSGDFTGMLSLLETAVGQPDAPNMIKGILANIYQKQKKYTEALRLWINIYDTNDLSYRRRAEEKVNELKKIICINPDFSIA
ncbi:MAG: hypothetical protein WCG51_04090 [Elusimicrobiota bacterium]